LTIAITITIKTTITNSPQGSVITVHSAGKQMQGSCYADIIIIAGDRLGGGRLGDYRYCEARASRQNTPDDDGGRGL